MSSYVATAAVGWRSKASCRPAAGGRCGGRFAAIPPLTYHAAHRMFERPTRAQGTDATLHALRHTAAYRMAEDASSSTHRCPLVLGHALFALRSFTSRPARRTSSAGWWPITGAIPTGPARLRRSGAGLSARKPRCAVRGTAHHDRRRAAPPPRGGVGLALGLRGSAVRLPRGGGRLHGRPRRSWPAAPTSAWLCSRPSSASGGRPDWTGCRINPAAPAQQRWLASGAGLPPPHRGGCDRMAPAERAAFRAVRPVVSVLMAAVLLTSCARRWRGWWPARVTSPELARGRRPAFRDPSDSPS